MIKYKPVLNKEVQRIPRVILNTLSKQIKSMLLEIEEAKEKG